MTLRFGRALLPLAAILAAVLGYFVAEAWRGRGEQLPTGAIDFALTDLDGNRRTATEWRGKVVLVNFWATWCPPCREEIPLFIDAQEQFGASGLQIVGIAIDEATAVSAYAASVGVNYPVLIASSEGMGLMTQFGNVSGALPYSAVLNRQGRIVSVRRGAYQAEELREIIASTLKDFPQTTP